MLLPLCFLIHIECFGFQNFSTFFSEFDSGVYSQKVIKKIIVLSNRGQDLFPHVQLQIIVWIFCIAAASSLLCDLSGCVDKMFLCPFPPAFSQGPLLFFWIDLHLSHQSMFINETEVVSLPYLYVLQFLFSVVLSGLVEFSHNVKAFKYNRCTSK